MDLPFEGSLTFIWMVCYENGAKITLCSLESTHQHSISCSSTKLSQFVHPEQIIITQVPPKFDF